MRSHLLALIMGVALTLAAVAAFYVTDRAQGLEDRLAAAETAIASHQARWADLASKLHTRRLHVPDGQGALLPITVLEWREPGAPPPTPAPAPAKPPAPEPAPPASTSPPAQDGPAPLPGATPAEVPSEGD